MMEVPVALLPTPMKGPVEPENPVADWLCIPAALPSPDEPPNAPDEPPNAPDEPLASVEPAAPVAPVEPVAPLAPNAPLAPAAPPMPFDCIPDAAPRPALAIPASGSPKKPFTVVWFCPTGISR